MSRIQIETLGKSFDGKRVLQNISLTLEPGRSLALIGPTAAGKTVLLKCLVGLYAPDQGTILVDGEDAANPDTRAETLNDRIGMLFQQNALFDSLSVWENIGFRLMARGRSRDGARARAEELLLQVGLPVETADLFPADLSGGMQKRVGFARAIATAPDILLLDNPTAGLDPILAARVDAMISALARKNGATVISATGNMVGLTQSYDDIAVLHDGELRWHGSADSAQEADNPWLRQLLSGSRAGPIETINIEAQ